MRTVIQRVQYASVTIDGEIKSKIGNGFLLLLGIEESDTTEDVDIDKDAAIKAMVETATCPYYESVGDYMKYGYAPYDKYSTAASNTLEYSYDDFALYAAAKASRSCARIAFQQASAASASAFTFSGVISLPSTTLHPGRLGSIGIITRWSSRKRRVISSCVLSIFSGQKLLS